MILRVCILFTKTYILEVFIPICIVADLFFIFLDDFKDGKPEA